MITTETLEKIFYSINKAGKGLILLVLLVDLAACSSKHDNGDDEKKTDTLDMIVKDFVFEDDRPFAQCHASTLVRTKDGKFLTAWFGGTHEKHDDVGIWMSKGDAGGWTDPVEVAKLREDPHWNPVLFATPSGDIILYFKVGKTIDAWETWYMVSRDNGETWSEARELVAGDKGGRGPVRNKPIILSDGTWLAPASNDGRACGMLLSIAVKTRVQHGQPHRLFPLTATPFPVKV